MRTLHSFTVPKSSLGDIMRKAEEYERRLYKYYLGEEPSGNYWKDELRGALRTNSTKTGRYVPMRSIKSLEKFDSDEILNEVTKHIINQFSKHPEGLANTAFKSLDNLQSRANQFNNVDGIGGLKWIIDNGKMGDTILTENQINGLRLELKKTYERYLSLKDGEVIVNTDNYKSGSPIFDIKVYNGDNALYSEVKSNLNNFRILGINSPFSTAPYFLEELAKNCIIDVDRKKIILSAQSIENVSIKLLREHFNEYQPVFESDEYVKLFTDLFINNEELPIAVKDEEDKEFGGNIEVNSNNNGNDRDRRVENYIKQKISRYMLWYSNK